jgi:hypothetical protein
VSHLLPERRHHTVERRNLAMHRAIALKLRHDPQLLTHARTHLDHWLGRDGRSTPYVSAWRNILDLPFEKLLAAIQEDSERMATLRQYTPLAGLLTAEERWEIYATAPVSLP